MTVPARLADNEAERLATLRRFAILDTEPEKCFDHIVKLAARQFQVPIALVSLVDENRQWFKATCGLDATETGRDIAFCAHAILGDDVFIVLDATKDERFAENPLVTGDLNIRFYAGAPLVSANGHKLGTLCLIDDKPRTEFSAEDQALLTDLATVVSDQIEMRYATQDALSEAETHIETREYLAIAEGQLDSFFKYVPVAVAMFDKELRYLGASEKWYDVFDIGERDISGKQLLDIEPHLSEDIKNQYQRCLSGETIEVAEGRLLKSDGDNHWVHSQMRPSINADGDIVGIVAFIEIIDDRKRAENELENSRRFLEAVLENITDGIVACDADGTLTLFNSATKRMHGIDSKPIPPEEWASEYDLYDADGETQLTSDRIPLFRAYSGETIDGQEIVIAPKGEEPRKVLAYATPMHDKAGKQMGAVASMRDVTRERDAEALWKKAQSRYEAIFNHTFQFCALLDADGIIEEVNDTALDFGGMARSDTLGKAIWNTHWIRPGTDASKLVEDAVAQANAGEFVRFEIDVHGQDGSVMSIDFSINPVSDDTGAITQLIAEGRDISERKTLEKQFVQAQKMETVGQLTGGLAHDFNNLLGVIIGNLQLVEREVSENDAVVKRIMAAINAADRGAELTHRLLAFSRLQALETVSANPNPLIENLTDILKSSLGETISLETKLGPDLPNICTDTAQLESAILNLAVNARDAMPEGGQLTIESKLVILDQDFARRQEEFTAGKYVVIAVTDTGSGIPDDKIGKVFDPFFTTKDVGKGSGLGLSMVYGLMKQSGGLARIYSEQDRGTSVRLYLPVDEENTTAASSVAAISDEDIGGWETILVVEDQEEVRDVAIGLLEYLGYKVISAASGDEALAVLNAENDIDLLFTDIVMAGGMDGKQLAKHVRKRHPELPIVFTTGYAEAAIMRQGDIKSKANIITKPYRRSDLARKIRGALDAHQQSSEAA